MGTKTYNLCHTADCCPIVEVSDERVMIGEKGNQVFLKPDEWEALRRGILSGAL
ncbi:MAG: hypothetical protein HYT80_00180 [Euryarchaeota archaeon]|nr:hypothetical protein [Euryarchaeota archaeon]